MALAPVEERVTTLVVIGTEDVVVSCPSVEPIPSALVVAFMVEEDAVLGILSLSNELLASGTLPPHPLRNNETVNNRHSICK